MTQTAKVIGIKNDLAEIEVSRKAMCDGCHKMQCSGKCAMSSIMSSGNKMTAYAVNKACARIGDSVEIESSDKEVLGTAVLVFILPLIIGCLFYAVTVALGLSYEISVTSAVIGVVCVFPFMRLFEKRLNKNKPRLIVLRILEDNTYNPQNDDE